MSNDFMQQHGTGAPFKTEFNPNDISVTHYNYSQGLFGHSGTPFYSQNMLQHQQQHQVSEMESRRSSQGTTNR